MHLAAEAGKKKETASRQWVIDYCIRSSSNAWPLADTLSASHFAVYLEVRKRENITASYLQGLKSGIRHLFVIWRKMALYDDLSKDLGSFMSGAKKQLAQARQDGHAKVHEGKEPLRFEMLAFLGDYLLHLCDRSEGTGEPLVHSAHTEATFVRLFLLLCWNLVCRSKSAETIRLAHMKWQGDALAILFAKQKNDQEGDNTDYRCVYANPVQPEVCPILALGIYWMCIGIDNHDLFPGNKDSQASRYSQFMRRVYTHTIVVETLTKHGIANGELGTHSARKGAATFCASGSTDCPSITAIQLRAGWRLEGVTGRYLRFAAAGDQHVGRTVVGLDPMSPNAAVLSICH